MDAQQRSEDSLSNIPGQGSAESELRELTRRLAEQVRIFDTALSTIPDFTYIFDREGRFIYVNQALLNLWGLRLEDAVGKNFFDLGYPDDLAAKLQRQIQQVYETRQGLTDETPYTSPTGAGGYYEYIFRPVFDADGAVSMVAGSTRDISERKRTEESLRRTQARLESALKAGLAGTFYWDITANRIITDENMMRYFSLSAQAISEGVTLEEVLPAIHDEDRHKVEQALTEAIEITGAYSIEYRVNHSDGKMRWLSARGLVERDGAGNAIGLPGFAVDITERKQAEEAIRFQAHLLNTVEQAVIATDLMGTIMYWNRFAETLYGWSPTEAIGRNIIEVVSPEATQEQASEIMAQLKLGQSWSGEFMVRRRDGTTFPASVTDTPIYNDEEVLVGIVGISSDITERKHTVNLLDAQKQSLEMVVGGAPLAEILNFLTRVVEQQSGGQAVAAILSMDEQGRLYHAATPNLPEEYIRAVDGIKADENVGTCSAAAACGQVIITPDIATDPRWKGLSHLPLGLGFQAAWSMPIIAQNGRVLGTFGTYFRERREPTALEQQVLEILARTAALAIERKQAEEELKKINEQLEGRIAERTVELMEMNANLQAEISERRRAERERALIQRRLIMAQEDERRRIARDMHDQFGQQITSLLLKLGILREDCGEQEELREQVETLEAVAQQLDSDVDFLVWKIRPTALDDLGLQDALTNYTQNWSQHSGIPVEVHTHGMGQDSLTSEIDTVLYRIAQEALNNIAKHAQASNVNVLLEHRADTVSLIIEDDGIGFDAETMSGANDKGLGLVGMRERAALVGGSAEIESQPGEGATVYVRIPAPLLTEKGGGI